MVAGRQTPSYRSIYQDVRPRLVGLGRFELPTPCPPDRCANQAAPQPVSGARCYRAAAPEGSNAGHAEVTRTRANGPIHLTSAVHVGPRGCRGPSAEEHRAEAVDEVHHEGDDHQLEVPRRLLVDIGVAVAWARRGPAASRSVPQRGTSRRRSSTTAPSIWSSRHTRASHHLIGISSGACGPAV